MRAPWRTDLSAAAEPARPHERLVAGLRRTARIGAGAVLALAGLLLLAWLALVFLVLPDIDRFRPRIEAQASEFLGAAVQIGSIAATSRGWAPGLDLRDVVVRDAAGRVALQLPRVQVAISPRSLIGLQPRLELLRIDGPTLEVRRDAAGRITVAGLSLAGAAADASPAAADWVFTQGAIIIHGGSLRWIDEQRSAAPLALDDADIELRNGLRSHELRIAATPPANWGDRFTVAAHFTQPLFAHPGDWRRWSGTLDLALPRADVSELRSRVDLPFELDAGAGSVQASITVRDGQADAATADLKLQAVQLRLASDVQPLALSELAGRLEATRSAGGYVVVAHQLGFVTADGARWPASDLRLDWRLSAGATPAGGSFSAQRLDLAVVAQLAARVPLGAPLRLLLAELAPQGEMSGLDASWTGALDAPLHYRIQAGVAGLSLRAKPSLDTPGIGRPGVSKAQVSFTASETGGQARLGIAGGELELPGLWAEPVLPLTGLEAQLSWRIDSPVAAGAPAPLSLQLRVDSLLNADLQGDFTLDWRSGSGDAAERGGRFPGRLDLNGRLTHADASRVVRYLPLGLGEAARSYVAQAAFRGQIASASFRVRGDLRNFPFGSGGDTHAGAKGEFHIAAQLAEVECACVPAAAGAALHGWPEFTHLAGELVFDGASMDIRDTQAQVRGLALSGVNARIPDLARQPQLTIDGRIRGALADMLHYVGDTPVAQWTGQALTPAAGDGPADLHLALSIPLQDAAATTVKASLALDGNDLRLRPELPELSGVRARIEFTEHGWAMQGAHARLLGGDSVVDGASTAGGGLRLTAQGTVGADALRRSGGLGALARAALAAGGQAHYRAVFGVEHGQLEMDVSSDLVGLAVALPAPLRKSAEAALPLRVHSAIAPESLAPGQTLRDTLRIDLGALVQAQYARELAAGAMHVVRGAIGVQQAVALPASGVTARLRADSVDAEEWRQALARVGIRADTAAAAPADAGAASSEGEEYLPTSVALEVHDLRAGPLRATQVVAGATRDGPGWRVDATAEAVALGARPLGRLDLQAARGAAAAGSASPDPWQLTRLLITAPGARLEGQGGWVEGGGPTGGGSTASGSSGGRSTLEFKLALDDSGTFLDRMGLPHSIKGGKGALTGQLNWPGPLWDPTLATLGGQLKLELASGQFLKAEPGAARLLGVLSLQSLPRRLTLDFRDVFDEGFAFDDVTGDVAIAQGVASTKNLRMRGTQAAVLMEGSADIVHETQDLHVLVVPEINAGTASLAYAVINPAIGLGTFLAQYFLRQPLMRAATREFHIGGTWSEPKVEAIERPTGAASTPDPVR